MSLVGPWVEYNGTIPAEKRSDFAKVVQAEINRLVEEAVPTEMLFLHKDDPKLKDVGISREETAGFSNNAVSLFALFPAPFSPSIHVL